MTFRILGDRRLITALFAAAAISAAAVATVIPAGAASGTGPASPSQGRGPERYTIGLQVTFVDGEGDVTVVDVSEQPG